MAETPLSILKKLAKQSDPLSQRMSAMEVTLKTLDDNQGHMIEALVKQDETITRHDAKLSQIDAKLDMTAAKIDALTAQMSILVQMGSRANVNVVSGNIQNAQMADNIKNGNV